MITLSDLIIFKSISSATVPFQYTLISVAGAVTEYDHKRAYDIFKSRNSHCVLNIKQLKQIFAVIQIHWMTAHCYTQLTIIYFILFCHDFFKQIYNKYGTRISSITAAFCPFCICYWRSHRSLSCSLRSLSFSACSAWAFRAFSLSSFSRAARRNCSKLSLEDFTADKGVDVDFCAKLAHEPIFFSFTSWGTDTERSNQKFW